MIYQRKDSKYWWAAVYVKGADGQLIKRAVTTRKTDRDEALAFEEQLKAGAQQLREKKRLERFWEGTVECMARGAVKRPGLALSMVWTRYEEDPSQAKRTPRTMQSKRAVWDRFRKWLKENYAAAATINDVTRDMAHEFMGTLKAKSGSTYNNCKNSLSSIWHVLAIPAALAENPWRLIKGAEDDSVSYRDLSIEEVRKIVAAAEGFWRDATIIAFYTGLRLKDIVFLRRDQIDGDHIELIPAKTKRKRKSVYIHMHPELRATIDRIVAALPEGEEQLFPQAVADYASFDSVHYFGNLLDGLKIVANSKGGVGFHSLRHTFVTINEGLGVDRRVIQGVVGHGSPIMTEHYSHDRESVKALNGMPSLAGV